MSKRLEFLCLLCILWLLQGQTINYLWCQDLRPDTAHPMESTDPYTSILLWVNGEPIVQREMDICLSAARGRNDVQNLRKRYQPCIRRKIEQIVAKEYGIISNPSYQVFFAEWKQENERRKRVKSEGGIIYGPMQYTEEGYYDYRFSMMVLKVKEKLSEQTTLTAEVLRQEYAGGRERFKRRDSVDVEIISADDSLPVVPQKNLDEQKVEWIKQHRAQSSVVRIDDGSRSLYAEDDSPLLVFADTAHPGSASPWLKTGHGWRLFICRERLDAGYVPFDEVRGILRSRLIDRQYEEMITVRLKRASVRYES